MTACLKTYFDELRIRLKIVEGVQREIDKKFSPDFNLFDFLIRDEMSLSYFLKILFDSQSRHGQQTLFLKLFFDMIKTETMPDNIKHILDDLSHNKNTKVDVEVQTAYASASQRRMDILISNEKYGVMIENKPWASDQENQIKDYIEDLERRFKGQFYIVYLSGSGQDPSNYSISTEALKQLKGKHQFSTVSYSPDLANWIKLCAEKSASEKMRGILLDFESYISKFFTKNNINLER